MIHESLQEARKPAMALARYTRRFRDALLKDEASTNGALVAALRCFRSILQSRDDFGKATDIHAGLQRRGKPSSVLRMSP